MLTKSPFLSGFPTLLFGRAKTSAQQLISGRLASLRSRAPAPLARLLSAEIPPELLAAHDESKRQRVYDNVTMFWTFLSQVLSEDSSCARAVAGVQQWRRKTGRSIPGPDTGAFVEARQKLPLDMLKAVHAHLYAELGQHAGEGTRWRGLNIEAIDGTSAQMPDTPENQKAYPQPASQAEGCGFPAIKLCGLVNLGHGGLGDFASGRENSGEMRGFDAHLGQLEKGDMLVGDRLYSSYEAIARLKGNGAEYTGRNHQARKIDFRRGRRLGRDERLLAWKKPRVQPPLSQLPEEEWAALPEKMEMRIIRTRKRDRQGNPKTMYVVSTLTDPDQYPAEEIASIYKHRWEIELRFRDIKTTMGMEMLRTRTPRMIEKEILMNMIAYNLIKLLSYKAASGSGGSARRIGYKGVLQTLAESTARDDGKSYRPKVLAREKADLLERIGEREVRERPGRNEPRKKKRRPKSYGWLKRPRHLYLEKYFDGEPELKILDKPERKARPEIPEAAA